MREDQIWRITSVGEGQEGKWMLDATVDHPDPYSKTNVIVPQSFGLLPAESLSWDPSRNCLQLKTALWAKPFLQWLNLRYKGWASCLHEEAVLWGPSQLHTSHGRARGLCCDRIMAWCLSLLPASCPASLTSPKIGIPRVGSVLPGCKSPPQILLCNRWCGWHKGMEELRLVAVGKESPWGTLRRRRKAWEEFGLLMEDGWKWRSSIWKGKNHFEEFCWVIHGALECTSTI